MARFLNANDSREIVWTRNTTESINLVANGLRFEKGQNVVTTCLEHHSGLLPFWRLQKNGIELRIVDADKDGRLDPARFAEMIDRKTRLVSVVLSSNVTGTVAPMVDIIKMAHESEALVLGDGAQYVPHHTTDVRNLDIDFLAFSIHKMCGPSGMGVLFGRYDLLDEEMEPFMIGGETTRDVTYKNGLIEPIFDSPPRKFEAGLQNYSGIIGTGAAVDYLNSIGMDNIERRDSELRDHLINRLSEIMGVEFVGPSVSDPYPREALATFRLKTGGCYVHWADMAIYMLEMVPEFKIMFRTGGHCAHPFHYSVGIAPVPDPSRPDLSAGTSRVSLYFYNTEEEIDVFANSMCEFIKRRKDFSSEVAIDGGRLTVGANSCLNQ
jgi:cysteine desulfurase/selenocysteine lyase